MKFPQGSKVGRKADLQQFRDACNYLGMTPVERDAFGDYLHELKALGERGSLNSRGDFTWDELLAIGRDFLDMTRP